MKTIVVACQKGGVGKSTLALNLLIEAIARGYNAAIYDQDSQGSCVLMSSQRERLHGQPLPVLTELPKPVGDLLIVDTAPHANAELPRLFSGADLIVVPTRPATLDLAAAATTLEVARRSGVRTMAVLMLPVARAPEIDEAREWLAEHKTELAGIVHHRIDIARSAGAGLGMLEAHPSHPGTREFRWIADYIFKAIM